MSARCAGVGAGPEVARLRAVAELQRITLDTPRGLLDVSVPFDVPIADLLPEFVEVGTTGAPAANGWILTSADGDAFPEHATLADCGTANGGVLVLRAGVADTAPATKPQLTPRVADERPLSVRTRLVLPARLTPAQRAGLVLRALTGAERRTLERVLAGSDPEAFARPAHVPVPRRAREAWSEGDYRRRLDARIRAPRLARCATIAVVSPKGGPGKTTITALLGSLLAHVRRDRVIAVDANPDFGSLGRRLVPGHRVFVDDLLTGPLARESLALTELDAQLGRGPDGLMVIPAPSDPMRARALDEAAYQTLFGRLAELAGTLVLDCGTGLDAPPARAALASADQLVLVTDGEPDTASLVWEAAQWLSDSAPPIFLVVNKLQPGSRLDVGALERLLPYAHGLATVSQHTRAAEQLQASRFSWTRAPAGWATSLRELAALLVADWPRAAT